MLLGRVTAPLARADRVRRVIDLPSVVDQLGTSLRAELDFRMEAENLDRMAVSLERYDRLARAAVSSRPVVVAPARDGRGPGRARSPTRRRARARRRGPPAPPGLLPAGARGGLLPRRPAPGQPDVGRRLHLAHRPRHGRAPRRRDPPAAHAAPARVRAGRRRDARRARARPRGRRSAGPGPRRVRSRARRELASGLQGQALEEIQFAELLNQLTDLSTALRRAAPREPRDGGQGRRPGAAHGGGDRAGDRPARRGGTVLRSQPDATAGEPARSAGAAVPGREAALPRRARRRGLHRRPARAAGHRRDRAVARPRGPDRGARAHGRAVAGSRSRRASTPGPPPPWCAGWPASSRPRRPRRSRSRSPGAAVGGSAGTATDRNGRSESVRDGADLHR